MTPPAVDPAARAPLSDPVKLPAMLLMAAAVPLSWLWMQAAHEAGHVLAGWMTGGSVKRVVLHPLSFSRTDLAANPVPLVTGYAGVVGGVLIPAGLWVLLRAAWKNASHLARFFLGFCLVANGSYLAGGLAGGVGDVGDLLRLGQPAWLLGAVGGAMVVAGVAIWNGQGPAFGLGRGARSVRTREGIVLLALLAGTIAIEVILSQRI